MDRLGVRRAVSPEGSRPGGRRRNSGFTLLEAVIVLAVGGILAAIALTSFSGLQGNMAVRSAQTNFLTMHAQARSLAIERGSSMRLTANPGNLVRIEEGCAGGGTVLVSRDFRESYAVTLNTGGSTLALCMTPRGYADPNQNSFGQQGLVQFERGDLSSSIVLLPLGQAVRP